MEHSLSNITKLFVSNLPEGCTPWELRKCLEGYGEISGSYVAKKRDKEGCRFGFVSFKNVVDKKELVKIISGVRMGENKLKVNIARYAVENSGLADMPEVKAKNSKAADQSYGGKPFQLRDTRSYSDVVENSSGGGGAFRGHIGKLVEKEREPSKYVVVPDKSGAFKSLFGLSLVGRVVDLETLVDFDRLLSIAKVGELFGKVLHVPKMVEEDMDLLVCSVAVLVGEAGRISDVVSLRWNMKSYRIGVEEEQQVWIPDCLGVPGSNGSKASVSSPVVNMQCSGSEGSEGSSVKVGEGEDGETIGINLEPPHVASFPMHEAREGGGGHDFEVRIPIQANLGSSREVGPEEFNGFKCGSGEASGRPNRRPSVDAKTRKAQSRSMGKSVGSPTKVRPKKRPRNNLGETEPGFGFVGFTDKLNSGLDLNSRARSSESLEDAAQVLERGEGGGGGQQVRFGTKVVLRRKKYRLQLILERNWELNSGNGQSKLTNCWEFQVLM
ncbi:putative RNA recognition motif domain, nucleotide-binding alpha-beta plait domain superfamily [Helianthus debilis subsp. tardiflorus]